MENRNYSDSELFAISQASVQSAGYVRLVLALIVIAACIILATQL
jgi:hypothetical protein